MLSSSMSFAAIPRVWCLKSARFGSPAGLLQALQAVSWGRSNRMGLTHLSRVTTRLFQIQIQIQIQRKTMKVKGVTNPKSQTGFPPDLGNLTNPTQMHGHLSGFNSTKIKLLLDKYLYKYQLWHQSLNAME